MVDGLEAVRARIATIEALTGARSISPLANADQTVGSAAEFDPFGDAYQRALGSRDIGAAAGASYDPTSLLGMATSTLGGSTGRLSAADAVTLGAAITGQAGAPGIRSVGGYGSMPIPEVLRGFGNGQVPATALSEISQGGHRLYGPAAASWDNLVASARAEGIELRITDSYRSYDEQVDLAERKGLYSEGGLAARPGTSNHGWGLAVDADVTDDRTRNWLQVNGPRFGWVEAVPREPWHWEFRPDQV